MRTPPEHDRAMLHADTAALRTCAARLDALTAAGLPAPCGPDWNDVLTALAERCRVAAAELDRVGAAFPAGSGDCGDRGDRAENGGAPASAAAAGPTRARTRARTLAAAGRLLGAPRAVAGPLLAPLLPSPLRRPPGGR
jgi:hypothetical protein